MSHLLQSKNKNPMKKSGDTAPHTYTFIGCQGVLGGAGAGLSVSEQYKNAQQCNRIKDHVIMRYGY